MEELNEAERQLLLAAGWFRSRYGLMCGLGDDKPSDRKNLEEFGRVWVGRKLVDWSEAFRSLWAKGLLCEESGAYSLTGRGDAARRALEVESPLCLYEYENFFAAAQGSRAHAALCERVYGEDLCQHGLADAFQLERLLEALDLTPRDRVLDMGCGNGLITERLSDLTGAAFEGVDISAEAIRQARARTRAKSDRLTFNVGNMNRLDFAPSTFTAVISVDTLYYVADLGETVRQSARALTPGGRMGLFFTQWINDPADAARLSPENTDLAVVLRKHGLKFTASDLTRHEAEHWRKKVEVLEELKPQFEQEGNLALYNYRHSEAARYAGWDLRTRSRHLYRVSSDLTPAPSDSPL